MNVRSYHRMRRIFFVNPNGFVYSTTKYSGTHEDWANQLGLPKKAMDSWARGYYWQPSNQLFFYVGQYVSDYERATESVRKAIRSIFDKVGANADTIICGGVIVGEPGTVWQPIMTFGTITEFEK